MSLPAGLVGGSDGCTMPCDGNSGETCGEFCTAWNALFAPSLESSPRRALAL